MYFCVRRCCFRVALMVVIVPAKRLSRRPSALRATEMSSRWYSQGRWVTARLLERCTDFTQPAIVASLRVTTISSNIRNSFARRESTLHAFRRLTTSCLETQVFDFVHGSARIRAVTPPASLRRRDRARAYRSVRVPEPARRQLPRPSLCGRGTTQQPPGAA